MKMCDIPNQVFAKQCTWGEYYYIKFGKYPVTGTGNDLGYYYTRPGKNLTWEPEISFLMRYVHLQDSFYCSKEEFRKYLATFGDGIPEILGV